MASLPQPEEQKRKVFVGNVPQTATQDEFRTLFGQYGTVEEVIVPRRKDNGMLSGFAFVTYDNEDTANTVIAMGTLDYNGVELKLSSAVRKFKDAQGGQQGGNANARGGQQQQQQSVNPNQKDRLFVGGLNESIDEQALRDHFAQFGTVKDCYIPKANGRPRGYGFVTMSDSESTRLAIAGPHQLGDLTLNVNPATPKQAGNSNGNSNSGSGSAMGAASGMGGANNMMMGGMGMMNPAAMMMNPMMMGNAAMNPMMMNPMMMQMMMMQQQQQQQQGGRGGGQGGNNSNWNNGQGGNNQGGNNWGGNGNQNWGGNNWGQGGNNGNMGSFDQAWNNQGGNGNWQANWQENWQGNNGGNSSSYSHAPSSSQNQRYAPY